MTKSNHSVGNSISGMRGEHVLLCLAHDLFEFVGIFIVFNTRVKLKECVYVCPRSSQSSCTPGEILMLSTHLTGHTMTNLFMNKYFKTLFNCGTGRCRTLSYILIVFLNNSFEQNDPIRM